jgi:hypothetical protein
VPISKESTCLDLLLPDNLRCQSCEVFRCNKGSPIPLEDRDQPLNWKKNIQKHPESMHSHHICEQPHCADKYLATGKSVRGGQAKQCREVISFLKKHRTHAPNLQAQVINILLQGGLNSLALQGSPNSPAQASDHNPLHPYPSQQCRNSLAHVTFTGASEQHQSVASKSTSTSK